MPPKKKQKTTPSPSKPAAASSSRSTRSRTRSVSLVASPAPTNTRRRRLVKAEPSDHSQILDHDGALEEHEEDDHSLSPVWDGEGGGSTQVCWVELPPPPTTEEHRLMFIRPKDKDRLKAKGKEKEHKDSPVWLIDHAPEDWDPFHFSNEDLDEFIETEVVALRPKASKTGKEKKGSASAQLSQSGKGKAAEASTSAPSQQVDTSTSQNLSSVEPAQQPSASDRSSSQPQPTAQPAPIPQPEPSISRPQRAHELLSVASSQPANDGLEDVFLGSDDAIAPTSNQAESSAPLFFDGAIDDGTPQGSQQVRVKTSPNSTLRNAAVPSTGDSSELKVFRKDKERQKKMEEKAKREQEERARMLKKRLKRRKAKEIRLAREAAHAEAKEKSKIAANDSDDDGKGKDETMYLKSELNEEAFARSTGVRHKEEYRNKLAAFAQARKKARMERGESISDDSEEDERLQGKRKRTSNGKSRAETVSSGSSSSGSDSDDSDSSSSGESENFIVGDDEVEYDEGFSPSSPPPATSSSKTHSTSTQTTRPLLKNNNITRDSDGRIRLLPISPQAAPTSTSTSTTTTTTSSSSSSSSILAMHGLNSSISRKSLDDLCLDWLEWAVSRVLLTWSSLSSFDRERLERNRVALKSRMRSIEESVASVTMRRQFKWYLTQYPKVEVEPVFGSEMKKFGSLGRQGCGVCHRKSQKAQFKIGFSGERYNQQTLEPLKKRSKGRRSASCSSSSNDSSSDSESSKDSDSSSDSDTGSDRSNEDETWVEVSTSSRQQQQQQQRIFTFFAGTSCAQRATVMHKLHHWEWSTLQSLAKHDSIRFVRRLLWRGGREGRGKYGKLGCGAWEVAFCVGEMVDPSGKCTWVGKDKEDEEKKRLGVKKGGGSELDRLRKRLKVLHEAAIDVNRAK